MAVAKISVKNSSEKQGGRFKSALALTWFQFSSTTSIHGLKFSNDSRANWLMRAFWFVVPVFCFMCAIALMVTFLMRYKSNPTRINVETNFSPINDIEFPAVTFCNPNFIADSQVSALVKSLEYDIEDFNVTAEELMRRVKYVAAFTNQIESPDASELGMLQDILLENRFDVDLTMKKLMFPCTKLLLRCRWEGVIVDCKTIFSVTETYQGYCCSFNIQKPQGSSTTSRNQTIRKTKFFGSQMGLSVILSPLIENNAMTSVNSEGIKILLQEYSLYTSSRSTERLLPHRQESYVEVRPERTTCSEAVRTLPITDRGCVFSNEYQLNYMGENCLVDCNMQQYIKACDCLPYFFYNTENVDVCNFKSIPCILNNWKLFHNTNNNNNNDTITTACNCPPQCNSQSYSMHTSNIDLKLDMNSVVVDPFYLNLTDQHMIVHVYFPSQVYRVFIRSLLTNFISLVANLGGVYSLLVGMSVLSALEIFYFFTLRLYMNYRDMIHETPKPKTFAQRMDNVTISTLNVPRLDTAKSIESDVSSFRMSAYSHY